MLEIEEIRKRLGDRNLAKVARKTGLNYQTVFYFCRNKTSEPAYSTIKALSDYLEAPTRDEDTETE